MKLNPREIKNWLRAHRRNRLDLGMGLALVFLSFWLMGNLASPYLAPLGTIDLGEDGIVGRDHSNEISLINNSFARFFYDMGDANCHQHASRSFFLNDNQMPFCSRCTAIFMGLALGVLVLMFLDIELNIFWIIIGLVPIGIDGGIQLFTDYESINAVRFVTGLLAGIVTGLALAFIIGEFGSMVVHRRSLK